MLSKCRCPHTGVLNFFTEADPLLAVGSVAEAGSSARYAWHCYVGKEIGGVAPDISLAEACLRNAFASRERQLSASSTAATSSRAPRYWQGSSIDGRKPAA